MSAFKKPASRTSLPRKSCCRIGHSLPEYAFWNGAIVGSVQPGLVSPISSCASTYPEELSDCPSFAAPASPVGEDRVEVSVSDHIASVACLREQRPYSHDVSSRRPQRRHVVSRLRCSELTPNSPECSFRSPNRPEQAAFVVLPSFLPCRADGADGGRRQLTSPGIWFRSFVCCG